MIADAGTNICDFLVQREENIISYVTLLEYGMQAKGGMIHRDIFCEQVAFNKTVSHLDH